MGEWVMQVCPSLGLRPPGLQLSDEAQLRGARGRGWQWGAASLLPALRVGRPLCSEPLSKTGGGNTGSGAAGRGSWAPGAVLPLPGPPHLCLGPGPSLSIYQIPVPRVLP